MILAANDVLEGGIKLKIGHIDHRRYPDHEPGLGFSDNVRESVPGAHVIILSCPIDLYQEEQLRDMLKGCKQYGALSVTVVFSYLRFRRQDHSEKEYEITRLRWWFFELKCWGVDRVIVCEPHSISHTQAFADEFGIKLFFADTITKVKERLENFVDTAGRENVIGYAADEGAVPRTALLCNALGIPLFACPKERLSGEEVRVNSEDTDRQAFEKRVRAIVGDLAPVIFDLSAVAGKHVIFFEDEVSTGTTARDSGLLLRVRGARKQVLVAIHPVCNHGWRDKIAPHDLGKRVFDRVIFGNTRPRGMSPYPYEESTGGFVEELKLASRVAQALVAAVEESLATA